MVQTEGGQEMPRGKKFTALESFNGKLRDELLDREVFDTLLEAKVLIGLLAEGLQHRTPAQLAGVPTPSPGVASPLSVRFGYASASGQGRSLNRATLVTDTGSIHGGRSKNMF